MHRRIALVAALAAFARSQQDGTLQTETHPTLTWQKCTAKNACTTVTGKVVIDSNWRWLHNVGGADYAATYGATTSGSSLKLSFVTVGSSTTNIGSRLFPMDTDTSYQQFSLLNQEFTFDVNVFNLPCGLNGALYLVSMDKDGGMARYPANKAGAKYGVGLMLKAGFHDSEGLDNNFRSFHSDIDFWFSQSIQEAEDRRAQVVMKEAIKAKELATRWEAEEVKSEWTEIIRLQEIQKSAEAQLKQQEDFAKDLLRAEEEQAARAKADILAAQDVARVWEEEKQRFAQQEDFAREVFRVEEEKTSKIHNDILAAQRAQVEWERETREQAEQEQREAARIAKEEKNARIEKEEKEKAEAAAAEMRRRKEVEIRNQQILAEKKKREQENIANELRRRREREESERRARQADCVSCMETKERSDMAVLAYGHAYCGECV
ncbi:hypothetical protein BP6252_05592 [Coleophoma cylindrospora]|uniref:cellulose 1,4-beta-cellobiosidase (non-reducing end) n=1 Tax=Coleophoma cylindrospora TaxID=1849047 RepID=A0A3D8RU07_9HELO|nr:hypothetical protein BP6252_05592 [Coleophoma cylindrospora]